MLTIMFRRHLIIFLSKNIVLPILIYLLSITGSIEMAGLKINLKSIISRF